MTNETKNRIHAYMAELPHMKEKVFGALLMFAIAAVVVVSATYAWLTLSRSPEISEISTTLAANGALEIALSKPDGSLPDELDIDESLTSDSNVTVSNLQWGNLINLSDASYGIDNLALRPAQLNTTSLLNSPLWGAVYGGDGRITNLDSSYAYAKYVPGTNGQKGQFLTTNEYGVRAIATYKAEISDATQQAYNDKVQAVVTAHTTVNQTYSQVAPKFSALGTMISKYAQNKLDDGYTDLAPYLKDVLPLVHAVRDAMDAQKEAYVALANLQNYLYTNEIGGTFTALTWENLSANKAQYNTASADAVSTNGSISLVGLTQFIKDYEQLQKDIEYLELYYEDYTANGSSYYWGGTYVVQEEQTQADGTTATVNVTKKDNSASGYTLSNIVAHLIDYSTMTIDLNNDGTEVEVVSLGMGQAGALLNANGKERKVYIQEPNPWNKTAGILYRLEQSFIDQEYRIGGSASGNAACTINVKYGISITVYGKAYTKASGAAYFMENYTATLGNELVPNDAVAEDTYGLAIDLWVRTNAEETCLTLEGATSTDVQGNIVSYDGINRIWGATGEAVLTTDSTTQGGGSCYIYYADTPEDMARSLDLLDSMKVAFVDSSGTLLATAEMDTANPWAVNGRITVPLVLDNQTKTTYTYVDAMNAEHLGYAITTLYTDVPVRVTAIVYLDGTRLTNDDVLAAAEIQGSLNIQFGSSVNLKTVGSNELIDDTRTVTATVSPSELDYDTATSDYDMTTKVTVNIEGEGADPTTVTAFFVRAINSTQGSREQTMTFTKQANGSWTGDYLFTAPGTYYLRQVRLDGVDYTLADPQKVEIAGFGLSSVTWSELSNNVAVRTSEGTHSTTVTVQFASDDRSKLPATVQARFVRDDGNTVNIPLTYTTGGWVGTGSFSASGVYQLQYLVANGNRYIDLALTDGTYRTLDLSLGMYVTVADRSGGLNQPYDKDAEEGVYYKKVDVRVYNNAGVQLEDLDDPDVADDLRLYYSNGASITNTINTNLVWDDLEHCYTGTLPIVSPGRYQFAYMTVSGNHLTKCTESPVYTVISPDPPIFDTTSAVTVNDADGVQFVPLTNDAVIDGIRIKDAEAASASAVVYSAVTGEYYEVNVTNSGGVLSVSLPTYNGAQTGTDTEGKPVYEQIQEGQWSLAAIYLWNCYDEDSQFREITADNTETTENEAKYNPILWVAAGDLGQGYLDTLTGDKAITPDDELDFSALTTTVSGKVNVTMAEGTTALGSADTAFGTVFHVGEKTGMSVTLTDGAGRVIPKDKITDVTLSVSYSGNSDTTYGYAVSNPGLTYGIKLNTQDAETGARTVTSSETWTYAGVYTVSSLTVKIGEKTLTCQPGSNGVPSQYTIKTAAPTADDIKLDKDSVKQTVKEFGGTADNVTGTFLAAYDLTGTNVTINLTDEGGGSMNSVVLDGLSINLILTHKSGTSQTYGGYTISGDTGYQNLTIAMTKEDSGSAAYQAPKQQTLLAGEYTAKIQIAIGDDSKDPISLANVKVYSMLPDVKITGVSPTTEVTVNANIDQANNHLTANASPFNATNQHGDYYAVVYMAYTVGAAGVTHEEAGCEEPTSTGDGYDDYLNYTQPGIQFTLLNGGTGTANINVDGIGTGSVALTNDAASEFAPIGIITTGTAVNIDSHDYGFLGLQNCWRSYTTETATLLGTKTIETVTSTVGDATITRTLANPLTVSQLNQENPTLTWSTNGVTIKVSDGTSTYNKTTEIPAMSSLTATVTANNGYHHPKLTEPDGVYNWTKVSEGETESVYTFQMAAGNTTLSGKATKYPAITFSDTDTADVSVTVDGVSIASSNGAKDGASVEVTVERIGNYCKPRMAQPSGVTDWTATEGDFVSTYTFTMPAQAVALAAPTTTAMHAISWQNTGEVSITVEDTNLPSGANNISSGGYVVPGHTLTIRVDVVEGSGGVDPVLVEPTDTFDASENVTWATYSYKVPDDTGTPITVTLKGEAKANPALTFGKDYTGVSIAVSDAGFNRTEHTTNDSGSVNIKEDNNVVVTLTAQDGYIYPRLNLSGIDAAEVTKNEGDWTATYSFQMPATAVDATGITVTAMPTVTFDSANSTYASLSMSYTGFNDAALTSTSGGVKVKPGTTVTVTTTVNSGFVNPVVKVGNETLSGNSFTMGESDVTLKVTATPTVKWTSEISTSDTVTKVYYVQNGSNVYVPVNVATGVPVGTTVTVEIPGADRAGGLYKDLTGTTFTEVVAPARNTTSKYTFVMPDGGVTFTVYQSSGCVTEDTLITLADGSQVRVDRLTGDEQLLVWNHVTGQFDTAPIAYLIDHGGKRSEQEVIHLYFSDGSDLEIVEEHVFYDADSGKYITLTGENAVDYIGNGFAKQNLETGSMDVVTLTDVVFETKVTGVYEVVTYSYMTCFTDGILTASAYIENLLNIFDIDTDTMAYDPVKMQQDIETYGLYTYEDLSHIVNEEQFYMHNGPVTKVAVGKGTITHEEMMALVKLFEAYAITPGAE